MDPVNVDNLLSMSISYFNIHKFTHALLGDAQFVLVPLIIHVGMCDNTICWLLP